jgi:hypothetical protein
MLDFYYSIFVLFCFLDVTNIAILLLNLSPFSSMRDRKNGYLQRLLSTQRKYMTSKVRKARSKSLRKKIVRTPAEKAIRVQQRRKSQELFRNDLKEARAVIMAEAIKLHQKHGGHALNYYLELLYQNGQQKSERKVSEWNAWVHLESKRLNEGRTVLLIF